MSGLVLLVLFSLSIASVFDDGWKAVLWLILGAIAAVAVFVLLFVLAFLLFGDPVYRTWDHVSAALICACVIFLSFWAAYRTGAFTDRV